MNGTIVLDGSQHQRGSHIVAVYIIKVPEFTTEELQIPNTDPRSTVEQSRCTDRSIGSRSDHIVTVDNQCPRVYGGTTMDTERAVERPQWIDRSVRGGVATDGHRVAMKNRRNRNTTRGL